MLTGKALGQAIKQAIDKKGVSKAEVARHFGVKPPSIQDWINHGRIAKQHLNELFLYFSDVAGPDHWGVSQYEGNRLIDLVKSIHSSALGSETKENATPIGFREHRMPLISWVQAGQWCESPDDFSPGDAEKWLPLPDGAGPRSFALRVHGDSMTSPFPGQRSYPPGAIIYIDPDRNVTNGSRVVARTSAGEYTFKVYAEDAGRHFLRPINPQYPMIDVTDDVHICGVVIGSFLPE